MVDFEKYNKDMIYNNAQGFTELHPDTRLYNGKYSIVCKIGEGGFGITYKAIQSNLGRPVCIKEFFPAGKCVRNTQAKTIHLQGVNEVTFEKYRQAFVKESKTIAALHHPNIVEVIDIFDENNTSYMVMTFVEGQDLRNYVERQGRLSYPETVNYIAQLANAVGYIHERNIYHRDIKPENVMITPDKKAILIDFGSARDVEQIKYTAVQRTAHYAPIEQYNANSPKGNYTDIYSIGATFYFSVTGKDPVDALERLSENIRMPEPKELNPTIPEEVNRTILKAMQIKAENRHQNTKEFMDDLLNTKPSTFIEETNGKKTIVVNKESKKWLFGIIIAVLFLFVGSGVISIFYISYENTKEQKNIDIVKQNVHNTNDKKNSDIEQGTLTKTDSTDFQNVKIEPKEISIKEESHKVEPAKPVQQKNTKTYSFGEYSGGLKNGIPDGQGTMFYTRNVQIAKHASDPYYAEEGDMFVGTWGNGDIVSGKLFDKNKNLKSTILAGKRPNSHDISKD